MPDDNGKLNAWELISARMSDMSQRNQRMDDTRDLLLWDDDPYKLTKPDNKTELDDSISITPNLPKVFINGIIQDLMGGQWQTVVEGVSGKQSHKIEQFIDDNLAQADEKLLVTQGLSSLFSFLTSHVCIRWAIGARWISSINKDGEYEVDCAPLDMRWTPFVFNKWVGPILFKLPSDLEVELEGYERRAKDEKIGKYTSHGVLTPSNTSPTSSSAAGGAEIEVREFWSKGKDGKHEIWVGGKEVYVEDNTLGHLPFVIVIPSSGFMLRDRQYLRHEGEDALFLNAGLFKEYARSISLHHTLGYASLYPAYEQERKNFTEREADKLPKLDQTIAVREGERHEPVKRGDVNVAGQTARADMAEMLGNGGPLAPRDYNTPPSAVLLAGETELIQRLQNVRKEALGTFRSQLARLMIDQTIKAEKDADKKGEFKVGKRGRRTTYTVADLLDPDTYDITYHLSVKSKRQEMANLAEYAAVNGILPRTWTLPHILMADDPAKIINDLEIEQARQADPAIGLSEMGVAYAEEAEDMDDSVEKDLKNFQSKLLISQAVRIIKQRTQVGAPGGQPPQLPNPQGNTNLLASLTGSEGAVASAPNPQGQPQGTEVPVQ